MQCSGAACLGATYPVPTPNRGPVHTLSAGAVLSTAPLLALGPRARDEDARGMELARRHTPLTDTGARAPGGATPFIAIAVADPVTLAEVQHIAVATGYEARSVEAGPGVLRQVRGAFALIIDAPSATDIPREAVGLLPDAVYVVAADPGPIDWRAAAGVKADGAYLIPAQSPELLTALGHKGLPRHGSAGTVMGIYGAVGGVGTSTIAASIAMELAAQGQAPIAVDGDPYSGGLDLLLGIENSPGPRWPELSGAKEQLTAAQLHQALPTTANGVSVVAAGRSGGAGPRPCTAADLSHMLHEIAASGGTAIVDLGRIEQAVEVAGECDTVLAVTAAEVRATAALAEGVAALASQGREPLVIVRHRAWSGLGIEEIESIARAQVIAELGTIRGLAKTTEITGLTSPVPRPLKLVAQAALAEINPGQEASWAA